jgi:hypothetical protein
LYCYWVTSDFFDECLVQCIARKEDSKKNKTWHNWPLKHGNWMKLEYYYNSVHGGKCIAKRKIKCKHSLQEKHDNHSRILTE